MFVNEFYFICGYRVNMDCAHLLPDYSGECSECGPKYIMDVSFFCRRSVHKFCEFCFNHVYLLSGCEKCRRDPNYQRSPDSPDLNSCPYKSRGCPIVKTEGEERAFAHHCEECNHRILTCPMHQFTKVKCCWFGGISQLLEHFQEEHPDYCDKLSGDCEAIFPFNLQKSETTFQLLRHEGRLFFYKHLLNLTAGKFFAYVQMVATEAEANRYFYQYTVKQDTRSINMMEMCHTDALGEENVCEPQKCIMIPLNTLRRYVGTGELRFKLDITKAS